MLTRKDLTSFLAGNPGEHEIGRYLAQDLTVFGDVFSRPTGEFIVFKEYQLDQMNTVDYVIFTNRSRMEIIFVETKGADFSFLNTDGTQHAMVGKAMQQIKNRFSYAKRNYWKLRSDAHDLLSRVRAGERPYQAAVGRDLDVDTEKYIVWSGAIIVGNESDERAISRERNSLEDGSSPHIHVNTWQSFTRRLVRA